MTDDPFRQPRIPIGDLLAQIDRKLDDILARLEALDGKQAAHTIGAQRTDDGATFLPGTGQLGATSAPDDDAPPVDRATGLATIHALRDATRRHPANPQEPGA